MITSVEMVNWRAYDRRVILFEPGVTFLLGANGIGKTSVLEAIAYGLTGEPSTVSDRGKLLRESDRAATVVVTFEVNGEAYRVERSQALSRALDADLVRVSDGQRLETTHKRVTDHIERLMGVSAEFLRRIVYMAEGDVFHFLKEPPGKAVDGQIQQVLGLTQLDEFKSAVQTAEKKLKVDLKRLQELFGQLEKLGALSSVDLEDRLRRLDAHRATFEADLFSVQAQISELKRENEGVDALAPVLEQARGVLQRSLAAPPESHRMAIPALSAQIEQRVREAEARIGDLRVKAGRLDGEQLAHQRVLDILAPYTSRADTVPCPVCHKPLTGLERESLTRDIQGDIARMAEEGQALESQIAATSLLRDGIAEESTALRELQRALDRASLRSVTPKTCLADVQEIVESQEAFFRDSLSNLERSAAAAKKERDALESERASFLAVRRDLEAFGFGSIEDAGDALFGLESRCLSLRAVSQATQVTLSQQRNVSIAPIYAQLSQIWQAFMREDRWRIDLDNEGRPRFEDRRGHQLDLSQFSGGEKTALLVVLHTLIAQYFSNSDFLLIDEPLEHLDPVNRRSLVRFLVDAFRKKCFGQAIVATFEESLVRKYMSDEGIHVIHL
jgi:DNA repair exonuclease SbcCD ATPase subunit